ncbi:unnamed protein product [Pleuronectes platessa]|uniref:Homeobox domain-containing protein n=1 Tax=Pleuronectes platessa TaxID=8262 RepID=A0A9N7TZ83_PLEPL|nr:unnamed protein product [Pleuronectes platessa]
MIKCAEKNNSVDPMAGAGGLQPEVHTYERVVAEALRALAARSAQHATREMSSERRSLRSQSYTYVKVWFQNRRTKQKKDTTKDSDKRSSSTSESLATCNILRLLEQGRLLAGPAPPHNSLLGPHNGSLLSSPGGGSSPGISSSTPPGSLSGGTFGLSLPSLGGTPPSPRLGLPPPHSLCFSMPLLGGAHHELSSSYGCGSSAFEPYMRLDRKESDLGGKKTDLDKRYRVTYLDLINIKRTRGGGGGGRGGGRKLVRLHQAFLVLQSVETIPHVHVSSSSKENPDSPAATFSFHVSHESFPPFHRFISTLVFIDLEFSPFILRSLTFFPKECRDRFRPRPVKMYDNPPLSPPCVSSPGPFCARVALQPAEGPARRCGKWPGHNDHSDHLACLMPGVIVGKTKDSSAQCSEPRTSPPPHHHHHHHAGPDFSMGHFFFSGPGQLIRRPPPYVFVCVFLEGPQTFRNASLSCRPAPPPSPPTLSSLPPSPSPSPSLP